MARLGILWRAGMATGSAIARTRQPWLAEKGKG